MNIEEPIERLKLYSENAGLCLNGGTTCIVNISDLNWLLTAYEKEKEKNKKYEEIISRVRNLSNGVVSYDIVDGKKYLGPRKNFSKQRLYEQFLNIELILKGNYIFLSNEEFLKELIEKTEKEE